MINNVLAARSRTRKFTVTLQDSKTGKKYDVDLETMSGGPPSQSELQDLQTQFEASLPEIQKQQAQPNKQPSQPVGVDTFRKANPLLDAMLTPSQQEPHHRLPGVVDSNPLAGLNPAGAFGGYSPPVRKVKTNEAAAMEGANVSNEFQAKTRGVIEDNPVSNFIAGLDPTDVLIPSWKKGLVGHILGGVSGIANIPANVAGNMAVLYDPRASEEQQAKALGGIAWDLAGGAVTGKVLHEAGKLVKPVAAKAGDAIKALVSRGVPKKIAVDAVKAAEKERLNWTPPQDLPGYDAGVAPDLKAGLPQSKAPAIPPGTTRTESTGRPMWEQPKAVDPEAAKLRQQYAEGMVFQAEYQMKPTKSGALSKASVAQLEEAYKMEPEATRRFIEDANGLDRAKAWLKTKEPNSSEIPNSSQPEIPVSSKEPWQMTADEHGLLKLKQSDLDMHPTLKKGDVVVHTGSDGTRIIGIFKGQVKGEKIIQTADGEVRNYFNYARVNTPEAADTIRAFFKYKDAVDEAVSSGKPVPPEVLKANYDWAKTKDEYGERGYYHQLYVEQALKDGKPVPAEVLADYPDLAKKYGTAEPTVQGTAEVAGAPHRYRLTQRPTGASTTPDIPGRVLIPGTNNLNAQGLVDYGMVEYPRPLTGEELHQFSLVPDIPGISTPTIRKMVGSVYSVSPEHAARMATKEWDNAVIDDLRTRLNDFDGYRAKMEKGIRLTEDEQNAYRKLWESFDKGNSSLISEYRKAVEIADANARMVGTPVRERGTNDSGLVGRKNPGGVLDARRGADTGNPSAQDFSSVAIPDQTGEQRGVAGQSVDNGQPSVGSQERDKVRRGGEGVSAGTPSPVEPTPPVSNPESVSPTTPPSATRHADTAELPNTAARNATLQADAKAMGLDELPAAERKSWEQSLSEARTQGLTDKAHEIALDVNAKPRPLNDAETAALVDRAAIVKRERQALISKGNDLSPAESKKLADLTQEFDDIRTATLSAGTEQGRAFAMRKMNLLDTGDSVEMTADLRHAKKNAGTGEITPKEQAAIDDIAKQTQELQKQQAQLAKERAEFEAAKAEADAQAAVKSQARTRKYSKESLDKELDEILKDFAEATKKVKTQANDITTVIATLGTEGTKLVYRVAVNYAKRGVLALDDVVKAVQGHFPDLSRQDIVDIIAERGGKAEPRTKTELEEALAKLRKEAKASSSKSMNAAAEKLDAAAAKEQNKPFERESDIAGRIKEYERRLAGGDYTPMRPKSERALAKREESLQNQLYLTRQRYEQVKRAATNKTAPTMTALKEATGLTRFTQLAGDLGAIRRQMAYAVANPKAYGKGLAAMVKAFGSEEGHAAVMRAIDEKRVNGTLMAPLRRRDGLSLTGHGEHEEGYLSRIMRHIPFLGTHTERAQSALMNVVRSEMYDGWYAKFPDMAKEEGRARAAFINSLTFRSNAKQIPEALQIIMTSPRMEQARWEMLMRPFVDTGLALKGNRAAKQNLKEMAAATAATLAPLYMADRYLKATGQGGVETDFASSDWLKIRIGNHAYDITAGMAGTARAALRMAWGVLNKDPGYSTREGLMYALNKVNPGITTPLEMATGVNLTGREDTDNLGWWRIAPLVVQTAVQDVQKGEGAEWAAFDFMMDFIGIGSQGYKAGKPRRPADPNASKKTQTFSFEKR